MNSFIETLNQCGEKFSGFAWPMFWQSSLLIVVLFASDFVFRRKIRASIRYALWLVVLVKLCAPPTLALPTSPAWWLGKTPPPVAIKPAAQFTVTYDNTPLPEIRQVPLPVFVPPKAVMTFAAWLLTVSAAVSLSLLGWLLVRWWQITRQIRRAKTSERLFALANEAQAIVGVKFKVQVKLTTNSMSPAVCGLFRPAILIPQSLAENFSDEQLRAVLLHELIHLRRRDVWLNFVQALLQIFYWWHPLVWLANARIRRVREEAVDDAVMLALRDEAESYASTLLEVAKLALNRPLASLGLVGIMESRHALRQRIERLVDFRPPRKAGLTLVSLLGILAFTAVAVPMGGAPVSNDNSFLTDTNLSEMKSLTVNVNPEIFIRNVKARAGQYMLSPTNDYTVVLLEIMRSEDVSCSPPHGIEFNTKTGEITMQNSPERLEIFRRVIEQLNRPDGFCELPLGNNFLRKSVLIDASLYQMSVADFKRIASGLQFYPNKPDSDSWWSSSTENFKQFIETVKLAGFKPIQRPRIQTGSGISAELYIGNATNSVDLECKPFANEGSIDLRIRGTVINQILFTNRFNIQASAENGGGIVISTENFAGHSESNLVTIINMQIVTNQLAPVKTQQNSYPPQIHIKARFVEVTQEDSKASGFDWYLGHFGSNNVTGKVGGSPSPAAPVSAANPIGSFPGSMTFDPGGLQNSNPAVASVTGIMTDTNYRVVLHALSSRSKSEVLGEPEVITTSGRHTIMKATKIIYVITNFTYQETATNSGVAPQMEKLEVGPVLDTVAYVLADGYTIDLSIKASYSEFLGYDKPTNTTVTVYTKAGVKIDVPTILPTIDVRQTSAHMNVWDGQTVVLGGMIIPSIQTIKDKVPILGDLPILGHLFQSQSKTEIKKNIMVFVTATIVDAAGNRIHSDDEMPFAKDGIPSLPVK